MENQEEKDYGTVVATDKETGESKNLKVTDFLQAHFADNRMISVVGVEDSSFLITAENPVSSGRNPHQNMSLTRETLVAVMTTITIYLSARGEDLGVLIKEAAERSKEEIQYAFSDNLRPANLDPSQISPNEPTAE